MHLGRFTLFFSEPIMKTVIYTTFLFFVLSKPAIAESKKITIEAKGDWQSAELDLIKNAAAIVSKRMGNTLSARCAYRNSWRGRPTNEEWGRYMGVFRRQKELVISIEKQAMAKKHLAKAPVGRGKIDARNDRWKNLTIYLNEDRIKRKSHAGPKTTDFWAATIAHELAHNMGLSHGTKQGASWEDNYAGYFVAELGYCVMTDGKYGSDMGEAAVRNKRKKKFNLGWH